MRLFVSVNPTGEAADGIKSVSGEFSAFVKKGNLTDARNIHLTLAFLGDVSPLNVAEIQSAMREAASECRAFDLCLSGFGKFTRDDGGIYWIGVEKCEELKRLHKQLYHGLRVRCFELEPEKRFSPHITLGRRISVSDDFSEKDFSERIQPMMFRVEKICLMNSERIDGTLSYTEIFSAPLQSELS